MAPPPPSKSYLWKFDDDSSTASSSCDSFPSHDAVAPLPSNKIFHAEASHQLVNKQASQTRNTNLDPDSCTQDAPNKSRRNKKNKRKKAKNKKGKQATASTSIYDIQCREKHVAFTQVIVHEFNRCLGEGVPSDGGWPLGIEMKACSMHIYEVDDYELARRTKLQCRWLEFHPKHTDKVPDSLESRPFDYKSGTKNLLFRPLSEHSRMKLLLGSSDHEAHHSSTLLNSTSQKRRSRSKSLTDQYSDDFSHVDILHLRNELEHLRASRSMEGHKGCTCRKLHVYILPPGGGGKKAHSRRMSVLKLKQELRKRHQLPQVHKTREELEQLLHSIVTEESCCAEDCVCAQNGINCQVDACSCWMASHTDDKRGSNILISQEIRERCGNKYGMYALDASKVDADRRQKIQLYCQETSGQS